jgi:hypothetical protein
MEATGIDKDAQVLRELLDEALAGRRRKIAQQLTLPETPPPAPDQREALETIQTLLLKLIEQGEKARSIRGVCLELLQEALAEARGETYSTVHHRKAIFRDGIMPELGCYYL